MNIFAQPLWLTTAALAILTIALLVGLLIGPRWLDRDFAAVLFLGAAVAVTIAVTVVIVTDYRAAQRRIYAIGNRPTVAAPAPAPPPFTEPMAPPLPPPRGYSPMTRPPSGAASPAVARNPHLKMTSHSL